MNFIHNKTRPNDNYDIYIVEYNNFHLLIIWFTSTYSCTICPSDLLSRNISVLNFSNNFIVVLIHLRIPLNQFKVPLRFFFLRNFPLHSFPLTGNVVSFNLSTKKGDCSLPSGYRPIALNLGTFSSFSNLAF